MKRYAPVLLLLVLLMVSGTAVVFAIPEKQEGTDLIPIDLSWSKDVNPGKEITFVLTYANQGSAGISESAATSFTLSLLTAGETTETAGESAEKAMNVADLDPTERRIVTGTLTAPQEGDYTVVVEILPIPGETNSENNTLRRPLTVTSALPPEIGNLFAGLGMFAAVMAIVAVGTEVVVDSTRVLLGLKRKVTALEALDKLKDQLPGQLAELGVSAPKLEEFKSQVKEMRAILQTPLDIAETATRIREGKVGEALVERLSKPVVARLAEAIREQLIEEANWPDNKKALAGKIKTEITAGEIAAVIHSLLEKEPGADILEEILTDQHLQIEGKTLKEHLDAKYQTIAGQIVSAFKAKATAVLDRVPSLVGNWLAGWMEDLSLSSYVQGEVVSSVTAILTAQMETLKRELNQLQPKGVAGWLKKVTGNMNKIVRKLAEVSEKQGSEAAADWLEQQGETLINFGSQEVLGQFDNELRPFLASLGLKAADIDKARNELQKGLGYLSSQAQASNALYVASLKELLLSVEERRNAMQSPFRKIWRSIRGTSYPLIVALVALVIGGAGIVIGAGLLSAERTRLGWWVIIIPVIVSILIAFFGDRYLKSIVNDSSRWMYSIGEFFSWLESLWNRILQRPNSYGDVEQEIKELIAKLDEGVAGTKVAAILQERTDKHRDEEASRLRWLRVISLIIGVALAYFLRVDAAVLLEAVIPEIAEKINVLPLTMPPFSEAMPLTPGMILTGLAAAAGSAFWHDQLDRLQASKQAAEAAAGLLRDVKGEN